MIPPEVVKDQIYKLQTITNQLKQAHRGHDVEWWDENDDSDDTNIMNDGSGDDTVQGSGGYYPEDDDDEDHYKAGSGCGGNDSEGSGCEEDETDEDDCGWPLNPCRGPWEKPEVPKNTHEKETPIVIIRPPNIKDDTPIKHSGAGSFKVKRWNNKNPLEMLMAISRFVVPQFVIGLGWYATHGIPGISFYASRTQTAL
jgi:hypothetical protein